MTEDEWRATNDSERMILFLKNRAGLRKLRLLAAACCRRVQYYDPAVIDLIERYADDRSARRAAQMAVRETVSGIDSYCRYLFWQKNCHYAVANVVRAAAHSAVASHGLEETPGARQAADLATADLIRCVFGNPFRPVAVGPEWLTPTVQALATGIYADRAWDRLPVLADALDDAGCEQADVLAHCRDRGPHARGCWVVDLLLGKS